MKSARLFWSKVFIRPVCLVPCTVCLWLSFNPAVAQLRAGQQVVIAPPLAPAAQRFPDAVPEFAAAYSRAGSPRIALLWNRDLSDTTQTAMQDKTVLQDNARTTSGSSEHSTAGPAESATMREGDSSFSRTLVVTQGKVAVDDGRRKILLAERHVVALKKAFTSELARGGIALVDRGLIMRTTSAERHRSGGDPLLIETDALLKHADLILEVLWVEDRDAPAGQAFDMHVKRMRDGREVASVYSKGIPWQPAPDPARWVAGADGYELRVSAPPPSPSPSQVGAAAAQDLLKTLAGGPLQVQDGASRPKSRRVTK